MKLSKEKIIGKNNIDVKKDYFIRLSQNKIEEEKEIINEKEKKNEEI